MVRSPSSSCNKSGLKKGTWTPEEDRKLIAYVTRYGCWNWRQLPRFAGLARCGKSCRLRWMNYLRPNIKRGNYTQQEEDTIISLHQKLGNRWSAIAAHLPGRTDNEIKNHWHTTLKKRIIQVQKAVTNEHSKSFKSTGKDDESRQENSGPLSPQLSWSESSSITTGQSADASKENTIMGDEFAFLDAFTVTESAVNGNFWTDLYLNGISNAPIEIVPDGNGTNASFQSSDTASALSPQPSFSSDSLVLENDFAFLDAHTVPIVENFWTEPYVADVSHVPNELLTPLALVTESDYFSPLYDAGLWTTQSNLHDEPASLF